MLFVKPPLAIYHEGAAAEGLDYTRSASTYAEYNYLRPGLTSWVKCRHFELALQLTRQRFHACNVLDFGCADGVFLPSLSRHFNKVAAIDRRKDFISLCSRLVAAERLDNVELICNDAVSMAELRDRVRPGNYQIAFVLETLEHVGEQDDPWRSRVEFLAQIADLLDDGGLLVVSVPKMVGLLFLVQRLVLATLGCLREPISLPNLLRAGLLSDTRRLEGSWNGGHLGFNHRRLDPLLPSYFKRVERNGTFFQAMYVLHK